MAVNKRTRYEVLRRDNHTCRYCGGRAPDVVLTVDHVTPTVLGGSDDPSNLVAACKDCNAGKSSSSPDAPLVAQVGEDATRWAAAMKLAGERLAANKVAVDEQLQPWFDEWSTLSGPGWSYRLPEGADQVLAKYVATGMPLEVLIDAARVALSARQVDNRFRYFQGVANNMLADLQRDAAAILVVKEAPRGTSSRFDGVRAVDAYWQGFIEAMHASEIAAGHFSFRALSRVVDGEQGWNGLVLNAGANT